MDECSGAEDSSPKQEPIPKVWQCIHCQASVPGMKPGYVPKFCIECGAPQIKCTNPKCNELLFSDKTKICHVCHVPQGAGIEAAHGPDSGSTSESTTDGADSRGGNHITAGDQLTKSVTDEDTAPTPPAAANDQPENQKEVKDIKTTTQTESPDPLNAVGYC